MNLSLLVLFLIPNFLITSCQRQHASGFLGMSEDEEREVVGSSHESFMDRPTFSDKGEYCAMYRAHYEYFCHGIWSVEKLISHQHHFSRIKQFCPTYTHNCITPIIQKPKRKHRKHRHRHRPRTIRSSSYDTEILDELAVSCTPECDSRMYPHCTQECKCDYDYPRMQRFCNPPALPLFLNICRLWYNQCPKYERYHYASQFVYSKAEKGKSIATPLPVVNERWRQSYYGKIDR